ncbi:MAG: transposase [Pseudomonadales bacterium]|nr:transposase [Pseudomonadales bacterium]
MSQRYLDDQQLLILTTRVFERHDGIYGSPRIFKALKKQGISVSRKRVARLMRSAGLQGRVVRVTRRQPGLKRFKARGENLLLKMDPPNHINQIWVRT